MIDSERGGRGGRVHARQYQGGNRGGVIESPENQMNVIAIGIETCALDCSLANFIP